MKGLYQLLVRFLPPYKGYVFLNVLFNLLGAIFGAFQFAALIPVLGILFGTQPLVDKPDNWSFNFDNLSKNISYIISEVIQKSGREQSTYLSWYFYHYNGCFEGWLYLPCLLCDGACA